MRSPDSRRLVHSTYGFATYSEPNPADRDHPGKLWAIEQSEAAVVRRIYQLFDEGCLGYRAIADQLDREHVPTPRNNGRGGKHGGPMSIAGQRTKNGARYAQFACTAYTSRGDSICASSNSNSISEKRITDAVRPDLLGNRCPRTSVRSARRDNAVPTSRIRGDRAYARTAVLRRGRARPRRKSSECRFVCVEFRLQNASDIPSEVRR